MEILGFGRDLHRDRRVHPDHSIFLHDWNGSRRCRVRHQHYRAFHCRRGQIAHHPALLVDVVIGNDLRRCYRSRRHLRARARVWRDRISEGIANVCTRVGEGERLFFGGRIDARRNRQVIRNQG